MSQHTAELKCRTCLDNDCNTYRSTSFDYEGMYNPSIRDAQDAVDEHYKRSCDECSDTNWRVIVVKRTSGAVRGY